MWLYDLFLRILLLLGLSPAIDEWVIQQLEEIPLTYWFTPLAWTVHKREKHAIKFNKPYLDTERTPELSPRCRFENSILFNTQANSNNPKLSYIQENGQIIDFIADTGDETRATRLVANICRNPFNSGETTIPRSSSLIIGGDITYPFMSKQYWKAKIGRPFGAIFREDLIRAYFVAGNHDWYDSCTKLEDIFATKQDRRILDSPFILGQVNTLHFILELSTSQWTIFALDGHVHGEISTKQRDYFVDYLKKKNQPSIILIIHQPFWLVPGDRPRLYELLWEGRGRIKAIISGDLHFYRRSSLSLDDFLLQHLPKEGYTSKGNLVHAIVCGGGGSFNHLTHPFAQSNLGEAPTITLFPTINQSTTILSAGCFFRGLALNLPFYLAVLLDLGLFLAGGWLYGILPTVLGYSLYGIGMVLSWLPTPIGYCKFSLLYVSVFLLCFLLAQTQKCAQNCIVYDIVASAIRSSRFKSMLRLSLEKVDRQNTLALTHQSLSLFAIGMDGETTTLIDQVVLA